MKRFVYINDDTSQDSYCDNRISNRKYTILNFLPKNLWEQFRRFMNQYFLLIACLQLWSLITPVNPASTWGPLIFIFAVSATKEAWDDFNRYLSDKQANEKVVWVVKGGIRKQIKAQDIHVGNIVWLRENDEVPCDLVLIGTSDPQGICYVEQQAEEPLIDLGCRCRGGLAKAHRTCIELWFQTRGSNKCEICQQVAANVSSPDAQPSTNYCVWSVDSAYGGTNIGRGGRARGCFSPLWIAFAILIGGLLLDVLISVSLGVSALPVNIIIGVLIVLGLGTAFRLALECCQEWGTRRYAQNADLPINPGYHPAV